MIKKTVDILRLIPTEENIVKNQFINNISLNENSLFFLNSFGTLYSINLKSLELNWFINLKQNLDTNASNLFSGNQIVNKDGKLLFPQIKILILLIVIMVLCLIRKTFLILLDQ